MHETWNPLKEGVLSCYPDSNDSKMLKMLRQTALENLSHSLTDFVNAMYAQDINPHFWGTVREPFLKQLVRVCRKKKKQVLIQSHTQGCGQYTRQSVTFSITDKYALKSGAFIEESKTN